MDVLILLAAIYALVNLSTVRFVVDGPSMQPNFESGQFLVVSRLHYLLGEPQTGDIAVFHFPDDPTTDYLKRIIAVPGDTVEIRDTVVYVNEIELDEPYIREACMPGRCNDQVWTLAAKEYFLMGDNRNRSSDSRVFGPVTRNHIVGLVMFRYWSLSDIGTVHRIGYPES